MAMDLNGPLVLVGAGNMGGAMLKGWLREGLDPAQVVVQDPSPVADVGALMTAREINCKDQLTRVDVPTPPSVIVMAVKPQLLDAVLESVAPLAGPDTVVLSVAAGKTISRFEHVLGAHQAIVRSIPNTPAAVGRGITVCVSNAATSDQQRALCETLLSSIGEVGWVIREDLIDVATAVSGSGPAYVFFLAECLAKAGVAAGLEEALAERLARATVSGAGELMHQSELTAETLRENVTSPNGTTFAALQVLMADGALDALMERAVAAAAARSRELAG